MAEAEGLVGLGDSPKCLLELPAPVRSAVKPQTNMIQPDSFNKKACYIRGVWTEATATT